MTTEKITYLYCAVCGACTRGRQWHNRDTGFGLCPSCADWLTRAPEIGRGRGQGPDEMRRNYGERGVHYCIPGQEVA